MTPTASTVKTPARALDLIEYCRLRLTEGRHKMKVWGTPRHFTGIPVDPPGIDPYPNTPKGTRGVREAFVWFKNSKFMPDGILVGQRTRKAQNIETGLWITDGATLDLTSDEMEYLRRWAEQGQDFTSADRRKILERRQIDREEIARYGHVVTNKTDESRIAEAMALLRKVEDPALLRAQNIDPKRLGIDERGKRAPRGVAKLPTEISEPDA